MHGCHPLIAFIPLLGRNGNLDPTRVQVRSLSLFSNETREIPEILELFHELLPAAARLQRRSSSCPFLLLLRKFESVLFGLMGCPGELIYGK